MYVFKYLPTIILLCSFHIASAKVHSNTLNLSELNNMIGVQSKDSVLKRIEINALHFGDRLISFRIDNVPIKISWFYRGNKPHLRFNGHTLAEDALADPVVLRKKISQILHGKRLTTMSPILSLLIPKAFAGYNCPWNRQQTRRYSGGLASFFRNLFSRIRSSFRVSDARDTPQRSNPCPYPAGTPVVDNDYGPSTTGYAPYSSPDLSDVSDVDTPDAAPLPEDTGLDLIDDNPFNSDPAVVSGKVYYIRY